MVFDPDFFNPDIREQQSNHVEAEQINPLLRYLQRQNPEVLAQVARSISPEVKQIVSQNVRGLLGMLPSENFHVQVTTDQDNLSTLLASAMMTGYFLRQMEQRMELEVRLGNATDLNRQSPQDQD